VHFLTSCNQCFEWNVSWKVLEKWFLSPGKPWNLVVASPAKSWKKHLNVCANLEFRHWRLTDLHCIVLYITYAVLITGVQWDSEVSHTTALLHQPRRVSYWLYGINQHFVNFAYLLTGNLALYGPKSFLTVYLLYATSTNSNTVPNSNPKTDTNPNPVLLILIFVLKRLLRSWMRVYRNPIIPHAHLVKVCTNF